MISRSYIEVNLRELDRAYLAASTNKQPLYFSKLALLELCGWIELSMDDIVQCHANRCRLTSDNAKYVKKTIIDRTYGFNYDRHFREMLIGLLGIVEVESVEKQIKVPVATALKSELTSLTTLRNNLAHSYVKGITMTIDAPSTTMARFPKIYDGLKAYEGVLRGL